MTNKDIDRLMSHTVKVGDCWQWTAGSTGGYGTTWLNGKTWWAHRAMYFLMTGIASTRELQLDHLCRNRLCINPDHLEPVTARVNIIRGEGHAAKNAEKTHCVHGHPLSGDNLFIGKPNRHHPNGMRYCLACKKQRSLERNQSDAGKKYMRDYYQKRKTLSTVGAL